MTVVFVVVVATVTVDVMLTVVVSSVVVLMEITVIVRGAWPGVVIGCKE
jgi:hypothetical protein